MTILKITAQITVEILDDEPSAQKRPMPNEDTTAPASEPTVRDELRERALRGLLPPDPMSGCRGHRIKHGVVQLGIHRAKISALLWEAEHGQPLPADHLVWRTCPTRGCLEVSHLMAGTRQEMDGWRRRFWPWP